MGIPQLLSPDHAITATFAAAPRVRWPCLRACICRLYPRSSSPGLCRQSDDANCTRPYRTSPAPEPSAIPASLQMARAIASMRRWCAHLDATCGATSSATNCRGWCCTVCSCWLPTRSRRRWRPMRMASRRRARLDMDLNAAEENVAMPAWSLVTPIVAPRCSARRVLSAGAVLALACVAALLWGRVRLGAPRGSCGPMRRGAVWNACARGRR